MKKIFILSFVFGFLLGSCENTIVEPVESLSVTPSVVTIINPIDTIDLDVINKVATSYVKDIKTKSNGIKSIKEIIPLYGEDGAVTMYVVNYSNNQGYIVLSGNNEYQPVLAYNETGNFDIEMIKSCGVSVWTEIQQKAIQDVNLLPDSIRCKNRRMWNKYFEKEIPISIFANTQTRSNNSDIEYQIGTYIEETLNQWGDAGYSIYPYGDGSVLYDFFSISDIPEIQRNLATFAEDRYLGGLATTVYIRVQNTQTDRESVEALLKSTWGQLGEYKKYTPSQYPVGCAAVAVGQIMRYHEYPIIFDWNSMAYNYPTDKTALFLAEVGAKEDMEYAPTGSKTSIDNACRALKEYGYINSTVVNHGPTISVKEQLRNHWPVYMRGSNKEDEGHAWVCDGFISLFEHKYCEVMAIDKTTLDREGYPYFRCMYSQNIINGWINYHMNWGWDGYYNGYYQDTDALPEIIKYTNNRKDIINIHP